MAREQSEREELPHGVRNASASRPGSKPSGRSVNAASTSVNSVSASVNTVNERLPSVRNASGERAERESVNSSGRSGPRVSAPRCCPRARNEKLPEDDARAIVAAAPREGMSVRTAAELCGWSVGWVSTRYAELRGPVNGVPVDLAIGPLMTTDPPAVAARVPVASCS